MQIFEITQRQPVNEGALSAIAGGIGRSLADKFVRDTLPGVSIYDEPTRRRSGTPPPPPPPYRPPPTQNFGQQQTGYASVNMNAPTGTALPATQTQPSTKVPATQTQPTAAGTTAASPSTFSASNVTNLPGMAKYGNKTAPTTQVPAAASWQGTNINVPAVQRKQAAQAAAAAVSKTPTTAPAASTTAPAASTTAPAGPAATPSVTPRPGHRIAVQLPAGGKYYKTDKGWTNELGQVITKPNSVAALEKRADVAGREEKIPTMTPSARAGKPIRTRKRR